MDNKTDPQVIACCPFCKDPEPKTWWAENFKDKAVRCWKCGAVGPKVGRFITTLEGGTGTHINTDQQDILAIGKWNEAAESQKVIAAQRLALISIRENVYWGTYSGVSARVLENRLQKIGELAKAALLETMPTKEGDKTHG